MIRGTAVNQDGAQQRPDRAERPGPGGGDPRRRCATAASRRRDVGYVEAHGTGTALGDPIEVEALGAVLGEGRAADRPLVVGSVKTNIGHLEAAAGIAGLIKVVLALQHEEIPPHLHFHEPNPHDRRWRRRSGDRADRRRRRGAARRAARIAGVSSFGFSGTNAHVVAGGGAGAGRGGASGAGASARCTC